MKTWPTHLMILAFWLALPVAVRTEELVRADSPDRYVATVIGVVSRGGKHLAAIANDSANTMCQAWHDCLHNNPLWLPVAAPPNQRAWRLKIYVMDNDPDALIARVINDFPNAQPRR